MIKSLSAKAVSLLACMFPILCLAYGKGYKLVPLILLLFSLPLLYKPNKAIFSKYSNYVIIAFLGYFLVNVVSVLANGDHLSRIDGSSRFVFSIFVFIAILQYPPKFSWLKNSILIGSAIGGVSALVCTYIYGDYRAFLGTQNDIFMKGFMPIQSGNMAMTFGVLSFCITIYHLKKQEYTFALLSSCAASLGVAGSYLSGTRGGWILFPIIVCYLVYTNRSNLRMSATPRRVLTILCLPLIVLITGLNTTAELKSNLNRIQEVASKVEEYSHKPISSTEVVDAEGSVDVRLELWKDAFYTFIESPIFGVGYNERLALRAEWKSSGRIHLPERYNDTHAHNQFFEELALKGAVGLVVLFSVFLIPALISFKLMKLKDEETQLLAQCALISIILMMGYCLTQAMFRHNSGAIFYPLLTVILIGTSLGLQDKFRKIDGCK